MCVFFFINVSSKSLIAQFRWKKDAKINQHKDELMNFNLIILWLSHFFFLYRKRLVIWSTAAQNFCFVELISYPSLFPTGVPNLFGLTVPYPSKKKLAVPSELVCFCFFFSVQLEVGCNFTKITNSLN